MTWPLPTLSHAIHAASPQQGSRTAPMPGYPQGINMSDPLSALWMLASQGQPTETSTPALGLGPTTQMANAAASTSQSQTYNKAASTPVSGDSSPFNSLALTMNHDAFSQRFPWMGE